MVAGPTVKALKAKNATLRRKVATLSGQVQTLTQETQTLTEERDKAGGDLGGSISG